MEKLKKSTIENLAILTIIVTLLWLAAIAAYAEPIVIDRGVLKLTWEPPENALESNLIGYKIEYIKDDKLLCKAETIDTECELNYLENYVDLLPFVVKCRVRGVYFYLNLDSEVRKMYSSNYVDKEFLLTTNELSAPLNLTGE